MDAAGRWKESPYSTEKRTMVWNEPREPPSGAAEGESMKYREAIATLNKLDKLTILDDTVPDETVLEAVSVILDMETINAVPKAALLNTLRWFWTKCVEEEMTVVEHDYTKAGNEA
jgi:hypothetical protein